MINFIIYEKDNDKKQLYKEIIYKHIDKQKEKFNILDYENKKNITGKNIYILSSKNKEEVLNIAKEIRYENNNLIDPIIILTNRYHLTLSLLKNDLLILSYIDRNRKLRINLKEALCSAYHIIGSISSLNFINNGEIYKIPYNNILYIEKDNNGNYSIIKTITDEYIIKDTINNLEKKLDSICFLKTHRSCIVNLNNIINYKISSNIITFINNNQIDLVSRDKKALLKERLSNKKIKET